MMAVCLVSAGCLLPGSSLPMQLLSGVSDKLLHFLAYVVLGFLPVLWAERWRTAITVLLSMAALGLELECGQIFVPGRGFELADLAADDAGILSGALIGILLSHLLFACCWRRRPPGRPACRRIQPNLLGLTASAAGQTRRH